MASYETAFWGRLFAVMQGEMPLDSPTSDYDCQEELKPTCNMLCDGADDMVQSHNTENSSSNMTDVRCSDHLEWKQEELEEEDDKEVKEETGDPEEPSFCDLIASFSADIDTFAENVDDLENLSENIQCIMRNIVNGDGRPVGAWKDIC
ncbi:hypothetical protein RB195_017907 [Necator americanus]|uniref:Uncharacterized protein n=1 Tax=Necator americanus TaxID=51031 RepID=A0ABR1C7A7_NECAM